MDKQPDLVLGIISSVLISRAFDLLLNCSVHEKQGDFKYCEHYKMQSKTSKSFKHKLSQVTQT